MTTEKVPGRVACDSHRGGLSLYFLILCIFTQAHLCMPASDTHLLSSVALVCLIFYPELFLFCAVQTVAAVVQVDSILNPSSL